MPTCQGRYAPPEAVTLFPPPARTILKNALFYHGTGHLQKILNIAADAYCIFIRDIRARLYIDRDSLLTVNFLHLSRRHTLTAGLLELRIG